MLGPPYTDGELPLNNDVRWWPIDRLFDQLLARTPDARHAPSDLKTAMERLGSRNFIASDLKQAMESPRVHDHVFCELEAALAQGRLRCMARLPLMDRRELVSSARWADEIGLDWSGGVVIRRRDTGKILYGGALYVWAPDVVAIWPEVAVAVKEPLRPAPAIVKTAKPMTARELATERDRHVSEVETLLAKKPNLTKAEQPARKKGELSCFDECRKQIPGLTYREFREGLRAERARRRALKQKLKQKPKRK